MEKAGTATPLNTPESPLQTWLQNAVLMERIIRKSATTLPMFYKKQAESSLQNLSDPLEMRGTTQAVWSRLLTHPLVLAQANLDFWSSQLKLLNYAAQRMTGLKPDPVATPLPGDGRFRGDFWKENLWFDLLKQNYLTWARTADQLIQKAPGLPPQIAEKASFLARTFFDSVAPYNFPLTNPDVLKRTIDTRGQNLLKGYENWLDDVKRGGGSLALRLTDIHAFKVGETVATTPGKVVFQTDMMQLIQYSPATEQVLEKPLLIVPPWINKFYIMDLQPKNSFVKWAVDQGHTVFLISWINPDESHAKKDFEDYLLEGTLAALKAIEKVTGVREVNTIGYCIGGTLLACTLAYLAAQGDKRVASATMFASLVDFSQPGELGVFIDEKQVSSLEKMMSKRGYLDGTEMATTFNLLRGHSLIWPPYVHNYLMGKDPLAMDLLYWNSDSTRMPAQMHSTYLRKLYLENRLLEPSALVLGGVPIDLRKIDVPMYLLSTREDHITPWKSTYSGTRLYSGPVRFVLAGSGHIAGVINHPANKKERYWTNDSTPPNPRTPEEWLAGAHETLGSWWPNWQEWVATHAGAKVSARNPETPGELTPLEDAPGSYVKKRIVKD